MENDCLWWLFVGKDLFDINDDDEFCFSLIDVLEVMWVNVCDVSGWWDDGVCFNCDNVWDLIDL